MFHSVCVCVFIIIVCVVTDSFMISSDDLGYGDLEVYPNPSPRGRISTPHLNGKLELYIQPFMKMYAMVTFYAHAALASQGMVFTDVYAGAPVCAPSRCALVSCDHFICQCCQPSVFFRIFTGKQRIFVRSPEISAICTEKQNGAASEKETG